MAKPHIIMLMADQLRFDVLGAYGDEQCPTPKLDLLAQRSTVFDNHVTPCTLCVPGRSSTMTGLYPHEHGAIINGWFKNERPFGQIRDGVELLPNKLVDADYRVAHVGVQQLRMSPDFVEQCGGVEFVGPTSVGRHHKELQSRGLILGDMTAFRDPVIDYDSGVPIVSAGTAPRVAVFPLREDLFYDAHLSIKMAELIEKHDPSTPLALFGMFWLPHPPLWAPRAFAELVDPGAVNLPPTIGHWYGGMPVTQLANLPGQLGAHVTMEQWRLAWAVYLGMASLLDKCVGRVLAALDRKGMLNDSLVVFTSDHGEMLGSHRLFQKMCLYEEAVRVPMIMKMPGQTSARRASALSDHLDISATMLDLADGDAIAASTGRSLRHVAEGNTEPQPKRTVFASYDGNAGRSFAHRMARSATHKLIHNIGDHAELYDVIEDPYETRNLINQPDLADTRKELTHALNNWMDHCNDDQPRL